MKAFSFMLMFVFMLVLSAIAAESLHEKLNGTWQSNVMTVSIDWKKAEYSGVAMGSAFTKKLTLMKEFANVVIFKADESQITAQFQDDGGILLTKEGGIPVKLKRVQ